MKNKVILGVFFMSFSSLISSSYACDQFLEEDEQTSKFSPPFKYSVSSQSEKEDKSSKEKCEKQKKIRMITSQNIGKEVEHLQKKIKETLKVITPPEYEPFSEIYEAELVLKQLKDTRVALVDDHNIIKTDKKSEYKQLKKRCRQLGDSIDALKEFNAIIKHKANILKKRFPHYLDSTYIHTAKVLIAFKDWEKNKEVSSPEKENQEEFFLKSLEEHQKINFLIFICPPTDFKLLHSPTPEDYIQFSVEKSFRSKHLARLCDLFTSLRYTELEISLLALIGDSDEEDYLWPTLGKPKLDEEKLKSRRKQLKESVTTYLCTKVPDMPVKVLSLALDCCDQQRNIYEEVRKNIPKFFDQKDKDEEKKRMSSLFTTYYSGLFSPKPEQLEAIINDKFATYAMHGVIAQSGNPYLVLIQTESPPLLRTKMLNAGRPQEPLPVIYLSD